MRSDRIPIRTNRRRKARFVLSSTRIRVRKILEHILCGLLVLFLVNNDVGFAGVFTLGGVDTRDDLGKLLGVPVLLDTLATPRPL